MMKFRHYAIMAGTLIPATAALAADAPKAPAPTKTTAAPAAQPNAGFTYTAEKVNYKADGIRLVGSAARPAHIQSPELDVTALIIDFDLKGNGIQEVRANGGVNLKLNLTSKAGGPPAHIESKSSNAKLIPADRKLILQGGIDGFYQLPDGPKNAIKGENATLSYVNKVPDLLVEGGKGGVMVVLPPESPDKPDAFGAITVTADKATFDGATGLGRFIGNAHAYSLDGPRKLDVTAPEFQITRGADGTLSQLRGIGKTFVKVDLPPQPEAPAKTEPVADTAPKPAEKPAPAKPDAAKPDAAKPEAPKTSSLGSPTHIEAIADGAVMDRASSTLVFDGNVKGFYRMKPAEGPAQDYNFTGSKATFHFDPAAKGNQAGGLSVDVIGEPVSIQVPALNLGM